MTHVGEQGHVLADPAALGDVNAGIDRGVVTDGDPLGDVHAGADVRLGSDDGRLGDRGSVGDAPLGMPPVSVQPDHGGRHRGVWIRGANQGHLPLRCDLGLDEDRRRPGCGQLTLIFGVGQEADLGRRRRPSSVATEWMRIDESPSTVQGMPWEEMKPVSSASVNVIKTDAR